MSTSQNFEANFNDLLIHGPAERRWEEYGRQTGIDNTAVGRRVDFA